ncbi:hypothetical protein FO519_010670 [Halicephalobus sp. NKZ332]|nr:hypothetical protein FO519_010670 [Halicephalobus sp. NKZ332]
MYSSLTKPSSSTVPDEAVHIGEKEEKKLVEKNVSNVYSTENRIPDLNDPNFQKYLKILEIDPVKEPHLVWIAEEGFVQPLGTEWRAM